MYARMVNYQIRYDVYKFDISCPVSILTSLPNVYGVLLRLTRRQVSDNRFNIKIKEKDFQMR